jgi:hypothetical protein
MRLSNDGGYANEGWLTYQLTRTWVLSTYGSYVAPRIVYVWYQDDGGADYGPYQDDIIYDPVAPQGSVRVQGNASVHRATSVVTLSLEASDDNSGVAQMRLGEGLLTDVAWQPYTDTVTGTWASDVVFAQFQDQAGNVSALYDSAGGAHALASVPLSVTLSGPTEGYTGTAHTFTASVLPVTATVPLTYVWTATGHAPVTHTGILQASDALAITWPSTGTQQIRVTALNSLNKATGTTSIRLVARPPACPQPLQDVGIHGPLGYPGPYVVDTLYAFDTVITPTDATAPITYTWTPTPTGNPGFSAAFYQWAEPGTYTFSVSAQNCGGRFAASHTIDIQPATAVCTTPLSAIDITGPATGTVNTTLTFDISITPADATPPITYTWTPAPLGPADAATAAYRWAEPGTYLLSVTARNCGGATRMATHSVEIVATQQHVYLPLVLRQ